MATLSGTAAPVVACSYSEGLPTTLVPARIHPQCRFRTSSLSTDRATQLCAAQCCSVRSPSVTHMVTEMPRREFIRFLLLVGCSSSFLPANLALADVAPGYKQYKDNFDGYSFSYPEGWISVRGAGADVFFRDPVHLDENVSVEISSPSSSRFKGVSELGTPDDAAKKVLKQYLTEFMSTRLGVRRESKIVSSNSRVADDGRLYYDVEVNVKSYANNQQLAVMPQDRIVELEWDRRYLSVLGVENNRLYELRLQAPESVLVKEQTDLRRIMDSFRIFKL